MLVNMLFRQEIFDWNLVNFNTGLELLNLFNFSSFGSTLSGLYSFYRLTGCCARDISKIDSLFSWPNVNLLRECPESVVEDQAIRLGDEDFPSRAKLRVRESGSLFCDALTRLKRLSIASLTSIWTFFKPGPSRLRLAAALFLTRRVQYFESLACSVFSAH